MAHLTDLGFTLLELGKAVDDGDVRVQTHPDFPTLTIANYTEEVQFKKKWNNITLQCRGLIFDSITGEVIARPWEKFFNLGQMDNRIESTAPVEVTDKMDGSLGILYQRPDFKFAIATRGSFASEQAIAANKIWQESYSHLDVPEDFTFLFEILVPWNRIVVSYDYDSEYLQQGRGVLSQGSAQNDTGEYLYSTEQGLEDVSSLQERGPEEGQGEARGEAQAERSQLAFSEQGEGERAQGGSLRQDSSGNSGSQEEQTVRGLQSSVSFGVHGLRPSTGDREEVQYRSGEELEATGNRNGEVRTGVRELSQNQDIHHTPGNLVLLGAVHKEHGYYLGPNEAMGILGWAGPVTEVFHADNFVSALSLPDRKGKEGYVIRSGNKIVKLKQADYVELHRIVTNLSPKTIWEMMGNGKTVADICADIPDEFHKYVEDIGKELLSQASGIMYRVKTTFYHAKRNAECVVPTLGLDQSTSRKTYAQEFSKYADQKYFFLLLDGKDIEPVVWQSIRPRGDVKSLVKDEG